MKPLLTLFDIMIIWNTRTSQLTNAEDGVNTWLHWNHIRILRNSMNGSMSMAKEHTNVDGRNVFAQNSGCPRFIPGSCKKIHSVTFWIFPERNTVQMSVSHMLKIKESDYNNIKQMRDDGKSWTVIANEFNVCRTTIFKIARKMRDKGYIVWIGIFCAPDGTWTRKPWGNRF